MLPLSLSWLLLVAIVISCEGLQFAINTWGGVFSGGATAAYNTLQANGSALDAVEAGCIYCEENQCDTTVGYGNHPDTSGQTSLDALIMDGMTFDAGSVSYIRNFRNAISIARSVMTYTGHTLLTGEGAEQFADMLGFERKSATTEATKKDYTAWIENKCQPNFYENIEAARTECGPYNITLPTRELSVNHRDKLFAADVSNHDTIGIITRDAQGNMACGTSTNGANHKVAGRVGDSPIIGAGCYVNGIAGFGAAGTGDGDVMMRFSPAFYAVTLMETGVTPTEACATALNRIAKVFPTYSGGLVCISADGTHGAAANNMSFQYSLYMDGMDAVSIIDVA